MEQSGWEEGMRGQNFVPVRILFLARSCGLKGPGPRLDGAPEGPPPRTGTSPTPGDGRGGNARDPGCLSKCSESDLPYPATTASTMTPPPDSLRRDQGRGGKNSRTVKRVAWKRAPNFGEKRGAATQEHARANSSLGSREHGDRLLFKGGSWGSGRDPPRGGSRNVRHF